MADTQPAPENGNGTKALGRNQRIAIWCYTIPYAVAVLPIFTALGVALYRGEMGSALAAIDRLVGFTQVYALAAVGSILVVSGAIKGLGAVAAAITKTKATAA